VAYLEKTFAALLKDDKVAEYMDRNYQRADFMGSAQFTRWARNQMGVEKQIVSQFNLAEKAK
jgi:tripartite-type tricarboxylate transporter receptor subunit TctC